MNYKTSLDYFLKTKVKVLQYNNGYKSGVDSVILASILSTNNNDNILDLGAGVGVISLCLLARLKNINVHALEKNELFFNLLQQNKELNKENIIKNNNTFNIYLANLLSFKGDILFNKIICNPPYFSKDSVKSSSQYAPIRDFANIQEDASIENFVDFIFKNLKNGGQAYLIYPSNKLQLLLNLFNNKHWGGLQIYPIYSYKNTPSKRFILVATKNSKADSIMHNGIIMHNKLNYTSHAKSILYNGKSFFYYYNKNNHL